MKHKKILAMALITSIGLLGAGYAAWNQNLTFNTNVSTATMKMTLSDAVELPQTDPLDQIPVATPTLPNDATFTWTIINLYPGAATSASLKVKNVGTISTKINTVTITNQENTELRYEVSNDDTTPVTRTDVASGTALENAIKDCLQGEGSEGAWLPNEEKIITITAKLPDGATGTQTETENLTISLAWKQANK